MDEAWIEDAEDLLLEAAQIPKGVDRQHLIARLNEVLGELDRRIGCVISDVWEWAAAGDEPSDEDRLLVVSLLTDASLACPAPGYAEAWLMRAVGVPQETRFCADRARCLPSTVDDEFRAGIDRLCVESLFDAGDDDEALLLARQVLHDWGPYQLTQRTLAS